MAIDVSAGGITTAQQVLALSLLAGFFLLLLIGRYKLKFVGLPDSQIRQKKALLGQREDRDPTTLRIPDAETLQNSRDQLRALFDADEAPETERATVSSALGEVRQAVALGYRDAVSGVPRLSLGLLTEALLVVVLGSVALLPTATFVELFQRGDGASPQWVLDQLVSLTSATIDTGIETVASFPYGGTLYALALTFGIQTYQTLYDLWWLVAVALILAAVAIYVFEARLVPDDVTRSLYESHLAMAFSGIVSAGLIWAVGVTFAAAGRVAGVAFVGELVGFLASLLVTGWLLLQVAKGAYVRVRDVGRGGVSSLDPYAAGYLVIRRLSGAFAVLVAPIVVAYGIVAITEGKLFAALGALAAGSTTVKVLVGLLAVTLVAAVVLQTRAAWGEVRAALRESLSRTAVRAALLKRGAPMGVVILGYLLATGLGLNVYLAAVAGLGAGLVMRLLVVLALRARYRASLIETDPRTASRLVIQAYTFKDADDEPVYYALVNTEPLAHRDRDSLVDALVDAGEQLFENGEVEPSVEEQFAEDLFRYGIVDVDRTRKKQRKNVADQVDHELDEHNGHVEQEVLDEELETWPEDVTEEQLKTLRKRGEVRLRNGYYVRT